MTAVDNVFMVSDITVIGTGDVTAVEVQVIINDTLFTGRGTARRDPADLPDPKLALELATGRALRDVGRRMLREANVQIRANAEASRQREDASFKARFARQARRSRDAYAYAEVRRESAIRQAERAAQAALEAASGKGVTV